MLYVYANNPLASPKVEKEKIKGVIYKIVHHLSLFRGVKLRKSF
jgi:hypothetical protein